MFFGINNLSEKWLMMVPMATVAPLPPFSLSPPRRLPHNMITQVCQAGLTFFWQLYHLVILTFHIRVITESKDEDEDDEEGPGLPKKKKKAKTGKRGARKRAEAEAQAAASNGDGTAVEDGGAQQSQEALFKKANDAKNEVKLKEAQEVQRQDRMAQVTTSLLCSFHQHFFNLGKSRRLQGEEGGS